MTEEGKTSTAESLVKFHHATEISHDSLWKKRRQKKQKEKNKDTGKNDVKDADKASNKRNRSKSMPELADVQISIEIPDAFSSDEEDFAADNGELEIDDALNRDQCLFSCISNIRKYSLVLLVWRMILKVYGLWTSTIFL